MKISLTQMKEKEEGRVVRLEGGWGFQRKLRTMGIREGKVIRVQTEQPFGGPLVVEVEGRITTLGRGMGQKIFVEVER
jgi:ferrous iron transport protein A